MKLINIYIIVIIVFTTKSEHENDEYDLLEECMSVYEFNQKAEALTGERTLKKAINGGIKKGEGNFGTVRQIKYVLPSNYFYRKVVVKIQITKKLDPSSYIYTQIRDEVKNYKDLNRDPERYLNFYNCVYGKEGESDEEVQDDISGNLRIAANKIQISNERNKPRNFKVYIIIQKFEESLENILDYFMTYKSSYRLLKYANLFDDLRELHSIYRRVHLDIKKDNIMTNLNLTTGISSFFNQFRHFDLKLIDYGLMSYIDSKVTKVYKQYIHPDFFQNKNINAKPYLDNFAMILTIVEVEYGVKYSETKIYCYQKNMYTKICFDELLKNVKKGYNEKLKQDGDVSKIHNLLLDRGINPVVFESIDKCFNLFCLIQAILQYDNSKIPITKKIVEKFKFVQKFTENELGLLV